MEGEITRTGIDIIGDVPWGTHLCQFYQTKEDLIDILVPYFKAGLENNEFCMWITSEPLKVEDAKRSLKEVVKDLDNYIEKRQIEILDASQWYTRSGKFEPDKVLQGWVEKESQAVERGFDGLRLIGNTFWLEERDWRDFVEYEAAVNGAIGNYRMLAICSYSLDKCGASEVIDVISNHQFALIRRGGEWELIESSERKQAKGALYASAQRWQTTFDAISNAVYLLDTEGKILQCNKATTDLLGKPSSEIVGRTCWELMHGASGPIEGCPIVRMKQTHCRESLVLPVGDRWLTVIADPLLDEAGNLTGAVHIIADITERKRAEEEIEQRNRELTALNAIATVVSQSLDLDEVLNAALDKVLEVMHLDVGGIYLADPMGRKLDLVAHRGVSDEFVHEMRSLSVDEKTLEAVSTEGKLRRFILSARAVMKDGAELKRISSAMDREGLSLDSAIPVLLQAREEIQGAMVLGSRTPRQYSEAESHLLTSIGQQVAIAIQNARLYEEAQQELAERKRAEEALAEERNLLRTVMDNVPDRIYVKDTEGRFVMVNAGLMRRVGATTPEEVIGKTDFDFFPHEVSAQYYAYEQEIMRSGRLVVNKEESGIDQTDTKSWVLTTKVPLRDSNGKIIGLVGINRDITERKRAEEELIRLYNAVNMSTDSIVISDLETKIIDVNEATLKMYGTGDKGDLIGRNSFDLITPEDREKAVARMEEVLEKGYIEAQEYHIISKDGSRIPVEMSAALMKDADGKAIGFMAVSRDITERKRAENLARIQRDLGLSLSSSVALDEGLCLCVEAAIRVSEMDCGALYLVDKISGELDLVFHKGLSPAFVRSVSHYDADSDNARLVMAGKPVYARRQELDALLDEVGLREQLRAIAVVPIRHEDRVIACMNIASHTLDEVPPFARSALEVIATQIGSAIARLEAEEALRESEEKYRHIAENPIVGVGMAQDGTAIYVNDAYCRMFGYEKDELVGESELKVVAPEDHSLIEQRTRKRLKGEKVPNHYVFRGMKKVGTGLFIEVSSSEPFVYKNRPTLLAVFRDVTEKRKMEEELLKADKLESVGILAGGIAHDFNNILTAVLGNISLARLFPDAGKISERLVEAERACMQAKDLTQQLLTFARGGAPIKKTASIAEILRDSASFALRGSGVRCEFSIPDDLWPAEVDTGQMSQVINNILINADHAMPEGGAVTVRAENVTIGAADALPLEDGEYVKITMEDQGIGIPEEHLQRIFDPYFTTKQKGSGLGLATSYSIIKNHDGHITAESQVGVGSIFYIYLPASPGKTLVEEEKGEEQPIMGEGRILVMDDEKHVRDTAAAMLISIGYNVTTSIDGAEAIEMYKAAKKSGQHYDAVIVDIVVPGGMGGKETIRKLIEVDPEVKAIVSSGYSNDPIIAGFREYGFNGAIAKPYRIGEMSEVLYRVINGF